MLAMPLSIGNSQKCIVALLILAVVMTCSSIRVQLSLANETNKPFLGLFIEVYNAV